MASEIQAIIDYLQSEGFTVNWFIFPATSAVTAGQINSDIAVAYYAMLNNLLSDVPNLILEPMPHISPAINAVDLAPQGAMERERLQRERLYEKRGIAASANAIGADLRQSIGVKTTEGLWLIENFPNCLLVPVEYPERYMFHDLLTPTASIKVMERMCPILTPYPWREESR